MEAINFCSVETPGREFNGKRVLSLSMKMWRKSPCPAHTHNSEEADLAQSGGKYWPRLEWPGSGHTTYLLDTGLNDVVPEGQIN